MKNKIYLSIKSPEEQIKDYKEQINAIVDNIDNLDDLILLYSIALHSLLDKQEGG